MDERQDKIPAAGGAPEQPSAGAGAQTTEEELAGMRAEVARLKEEAERNWQQFLHAAADLENYKKQAVRQRDEAVRRARFGLLGTLLVVADNLERALEHSGASDGEQIVEGIRMTLRQLMDVLGALGVKPIVAKGQEFDPRYHEAVDIAGHEVHGVASGTVVEELQRGYLFNGEVLRHAKVRVAK